jgi:hypothetical protein
LLFETWKPEIAFYFIQPAGHMEVLLHHHTEQQSINQANGKLVGAGGDESRFGSSTLDAAT